MTNLQQLKEEARKEFDEKFVEFAPDGSKWGVGLRVIHKGTTDDAIILEDIKDFIDSLITKAYEEGKKSLQEPTEERVWVKKYKHKQLWWIAEYMEEYWDECNWRYFINWDEANTIDYEIVETWNDWEIIA